MAKTGVSNLVYKGTLSGSVGKIINVDVQYNRNDAKLYGDNTIIETDNSILGGTVTIEIDEIRDIVNTEFLGHTILGSETSIANTDIAPFVGIGFMGEIRLAGARKYRTLFFPKVQFSEPNDTYRTRGERVEFLTPTIEGELYDDASGKFVYTEVFDNSADAIAWLNTKADIPVSASGGLTALALSGGTLAPAFAAGTLLYTVAISGANTTVTATAADHNIKLYINGVYSQELTSGTASSSIPVSAGSKKLTIVAQETGKQSQTTEIVLTK